MANAVESVESKKLAQSRKAIDQVIAACRAEQATTPLSDELAAINLAALSKDLGLLLHAQCTKLSLAAKPPRTAEAVLACIDEIVKLLPAFATLASSLRKDVHSAAVSDYIRSNVHYCMIGSKSLIETALDTEAAAVRLEQTGILWDSCAKLQNVAGANVATSLKLKETSVMINDAIEDLQSFSAGEGGDDDDDFDDSASEKSNEQTEETGAESSAAAQAELQRRTNILQRIQLLLRALDKRRISGASVNVLNQIYDNLLALIVEVDDFACEIQEAADEAFIMELEKAVLHRVEALLTSALVENKDEKWTSWVETFRQRWLESKKTIKHYTTCPTYDTFLQEHLKPLVPCLIDGLTEHWPAQKRWTTESDGMRIPNYKYLMEHFGSDQVNVTRNNEFSSQALFSEFLQEMQKGATVYARDIHLHKRHPSEQMYTVPEIFKDDWLNLYCDAHSEDDYRFVYIGSHGTKTGLHKDVVASHSWSSNLTGTKIWTLIPPAAAVHLLSEDQVCAPALFDIDEPKRWPQLRLAQDAAIQVTQQPDQTIFVPSTWYHSVENVGNTLSINQNWINAACLLPIYQNLVKEVALSAAAINDLRVDGILDDASFSKTAQEVTMANAGMDYKLYFSMILHRLKCEGEYQCSRPDRAFEAAQARTVCESWKQLDDSRHLDESLALVDRILGQLEFN